MFEGRGGVSGVDGSVGVNDPLAYGRELVWEDNPPVPDFQQWRALSSRQHHNFCFINASGRSANRHSRVLIRRSPPPATPAPSLLLPLARKSCRPDGIDGIGWKKVGRDGSREVILVQLLQFNIIIFFQDDEVSVSF